MSAQASCDSGSPVSVHYEIAVGSYPGSNSGAAVSGVVLSGFPAACDGAAVTLEMRGNRAGDPLLTPNILLSTADSKLDPCSQRVLSTPLVVTNGSITLSLCERGGQAGYASVHDLTLLTLLMSAPIPTSTSTPTPTPTSGVLGVHTSPSPSQRHHSSVLGATTLTPATGADLPVVISRVFMILSMAFMLAGLWVWRRQCYFGPG